MMRYPELPIALKQHLPDGRIDPIFISPCDLLVVWAVCAHPNTCRAPMSRCDLLVSQIGPVVPMGLSDVEVAADA